MARVNLEKINDNLKPEMRRALEAAVREVIPTAEFDAHELFRAFQRAVRRKCGGWTHVSDTAVQMD